MDLLPDFSDLKKNSLEIPSGTTFSIQKVGRTDGYDGHCLRAYAYFGDHMSGIDPDSVHSINSIKDAYDSDRQNSKAPTFALTYQGTYITLMKNCAFSLELARFIEDSYHKLYKVSDDWVASKLQEATQKGYITCAFGLRVRTPLLKQVILGTNKTPYEAAKEGRTAGNALGQSWGLLNSRAASAFMKRVRRSNYRLHIRPCAQIHDAQYYLIQDNIDVLLYVNEHLVHEVQWQEDPLIAHEDVKLTGKLSVFHPNWAFEAKIPNNASESQIFEIVEEHLKKDFS